MKFNEWVGNKGKNKNGGVDPQTSEQKKIFKKVDLITLPENVGGTNCGNCKFFELDKDSIGFCSHKDIKQWVSKRNCCIHWDNPGAIRNW